MRRLQPNGQPLTERITSHAALARQAEEQQNSTVEPNLYRIDLPEGDVGSINIGWFDNGADKLDPQSWLSEGYDGVHFVGKGTNKTHIRCTSWDKETVTVGQHNGIVRFSDASVYGGRGDAKGKAFHFGSATHNLVPNFELWLNDLDVIAEAPDSKNPKRTTWLIFMYQSDLRMENCRIDGEQLNEHDVYMHGTAGKGARVRSCVFEGSGAENFKVRSDMSETVWAGPNVFFHLHDTEFRNWHQPWSWRGGAGVVFQGAAGHIFIDKCAFFPRSGHGNVSDGVASKSIMLSAEGGSYDYLTGQVNKGYGNGWVYVRRTAVESSGPGAPTLTDELLNTGTWGGDQTAALAYLIEDCGFWGKNMMVKPYGGGDFPIEPWIIKGCNTPAIVNAAQKHYGMKCEHEAQYFGPEGPTPMSRDIVSND